MEKADIVVVGSSNTDMVVKADRIPSPGETILGGTFFMNPGGKGANQAVAAARAGGRVAFVCRVGNDVFGRQSVEQMKASGVRTEMVITDSNLPSGVALIVVDKHGENSITVASGANSALSANDVKNADSVIRSSKVILTQLETPLETIEYLAELLVSLGKTFILNPAPARQLPTNIFPRISVITPNKTEAEMLTGIAVNDIDSATKAGRSLLKMGVQRVIITLGSDGSVIVDGNNVHHVPADKVDAVDTTAAGDVYNGALAVSLAEGSDLISAAKFATRAAAISVTRLGAQSSAPFRKEILL